MSRALERSNRCEVCGNDYPHSLHVRTAYDPSKEHVFDCFECAIHALAPTCQHCGCRVIGHGIERAQRIYCCDHCVRAAESEDADLSRDSFPASDAPGVSGVRTGRPAPPELRGKEGRIGWIVLWLLGVPIPVLLLLYGLRGCT